MILKSDIGLFKIISLHLIRSNCIKINSKILGMIKLGFQVYLESNYETKNLIIFDENVIYLWRKFSLISLSNQYFKNDFRAHQYIISNYIFFLIL